MALFLAMCENPELLEKSVAEFDVSNQQTVCNNVCGMNNNPCASPNGNMIKFAFNYYLSQSHGYNERGFRMSK